MIIFPERATVKGCAFGVKRSVNIYQVLAFFVFLMV